MEFNLINLALVLFLTGLGSFGGGIGAVNILKEFLLRNNWIHEAMPNAGNTLNEFFRLISIMQYSGYSQGIMLSTYLGAKFGVVGVILSVIAFILPSILIVILLLKIGERLYKNINFQFSLKYMNLLAAGLIGVMLFNFTVLVFELDPIFYLALAGIAFYANIFFNVKPLYIILFGGVFGAIFRA